LLFHAGTLTTERRLQAWPLYNTEHHHVETEHGQEDGEAHDTGPFNPRSGRSRADVFARFSWSPLQAIWAPYTIIKTWDYEGSHIKCIHDPVSGKKLISVNDTEVYSDSRLMDLDDDFEYVQAHPNSRKGIV